jgi:hypothetical protein
MPNVNTSGAYSTPPLKTSITPNSSNTVATTTAATTATVENNLLLTSSTATSPNNAQQQQQPPQQQHSLILEKHRRILERHAHFVEAWQQAERNCGPLTNTSVLALMQELNEAKKRYGQQTS